VTGALPQGFAENPAYRSARGPIPVRNLRPYQLLFLQFAPESPDLLPAGKTRLALQLDLANNTLVPDPKEGATVIEDHELQRLLLMWQRGIDANTEAAVLVPILWRNGGILDNIINGWHDLFGIRGTPDTPAGRTAYRLYHSLIYLKDSKGNVRVNRGNAFGWGDVSATIKRRLLPSTPRSALALRIGLKLPTGNPGLLLGSGGADLGLCMDARYSLGRNIILFGSAGGVLMSKATRVPNAQPGLAQFLFAVEYRPNNRDSFLWQIDGSGAAVRTGNRFADRANIIGTFGYKRVLDRHLVLTLSFTENGDYQNYTTPILGQVGPDFTASMGLEWHP
jgi:hypothetical protein